MKKKFRSTVTTLGNYHTVIATCSILTQNLLLYNFGMGYSSYDSNYCIYENSNLLDEYRILDCIFNNVWKYIV